MESRRDGRHCVGESGSAVGGSRLDWTSRGISSDDGWCALRGYQLNDLREGGESGKPGEYEQEEEEVGVWGIHV